MNFGASVAYPEAPNDHFWPCSCCHRSFTSFQAVRRHESGSHRIQHVANLYLDTLECKACLKVCPTKVNLRMHFTAIPRCLAIHRVCFPFSLGPPMQEVAKGIEVMRLNCLWTLFRLKVRTSVILRHTVG